MLVGEQGPCWIAMTRWGLTADLRATDRRTIVFVHQGLDVSDDHGVKNAPEVRRVLESTGRVLAVFQGHSHENDYQLAQRVWRNPPETS
jgi:hypothetical protein